MSPEGSVEAAPRTFNGVEGKVAEFTCSAEGGPNNAFTWTRTFGDVTVATDSMLTVNIMSAMDGGDYECLVENAAGNGSAVVTLNGTYMHIRTCIHTCTYTHVYTHVSRSRYKLFWIESGLWCSC